MDTYSTFFLKKKHEYTTKIELFYFILFLIRSKFEGWMFKSLLNKNFQEKYYEFLYKKITLD